MTRVRNIAARVARLKPRAVAALPAVGLTVGVVSIVAGVCLIYVPAGFIVFGSLVIYAVAQGLNGGSGAKGSA